MSKSWSQKRKTDKIVVLPGQKPNDRPDIIVLHLQFKQKVHLLIAWRGAMLYVFNPMEKPTAHLHLVWLELRIAANMIDLVVSSQIPDLNRDPLLYYIVKSNTNHGSCMNPNSPCTKINVNTERNISVLFSRTLRPEKMDALCIWGCTRRWVNLDNTESCATIMSFYLPSMRWR